MPTLLVALARDRVQADLAYGVQSMVGRPENRLVNGPDCPVSILKRGRSR